MAERRRIHLVLDVNDDGTPLVHFARQIVNGLRPDVTVVDVDYDVITTAPEGLTPLPDVDAVFCPLRVLGRVNGGMVFHRPAFVWARRVYEPGTVAKIRGGIVHQGPDSFRHVQFGGQASLYSYTIADDLPDAVARMLRMHTERPG